MQSAIITQLYELAGPALIFPARTGLVYRNQTGGHSCYQSEIEGYVVPIAGDRVEFLARLDSHFTGPKWGGWCSHGIDDQTADEIDPLFAELVHREEVAVNCEAGLTKRRCLTGIVRV